MYSLIYLYTSPPLCRIPFFFFLVFLPLFNESLKQKTQISKYTTLAQLVRRTQKDNDFSNSSKIERLDFIFSFLTVLKICAKKKARRERERWQGKREHAIRIRILKSWCSV